MADTKTDMLPICLPVLPLRGVVMFPQTILNLDVAREKSARAIEHAMKHNRKIFIVAQKDVQQEDPSFSDLYRVGVVAEIQQVVRARNEKLRIMVEGLYRAAISDEVTDFEPFFLAEVTELPYRGLRTGSTDKMNALMRTVKDLYERYCELSPKMSKDLIPNAMLTDDTVYLVDYIGGNMILAPDKKQTLLNENSIAKRLQLLASLLEGEINILTLERELYAKVKEQIDQNQREYYLREQQRAIAEELGEGDNIDNEADEHLKKIEALSLNDEAKEKLTAEVRKLRKLHPSSQEAGVVRGYLDTCLELPWNVYTKDKIDIKAAARAARPGALWSAEGQGADPGTACSASAGAGHQRTDHLSGGPVRRGQDFHCPLYRRGDGTQVRAHVAWAVSEDESDIRVTARPTSARCPVGSWLPSSRPAAATR